MTGQLETLLPGTKNRKPFDIAGFIYRYAVLIIVLGNFGFTLLAPFALLGIKPYYKTSGHIKIDPVVQTIIGRDEDASILRQYSDYAQTQSIRLRDPDVLMKAAARLGEKEKQALFFKGASDEDCALMLAQRLFISPVKQTHLIKVALQGNAPEGLAPAVNHIMDVYVETMEKENELKNSKRLKYLESERDKLRSHIREKSGQLQDLARQTWTSSFSEEYNFFYKRALEYQNAYVKLHLQRVEAQSVYNQKLKEKLEISALSLKPYVEEMVAQDWAIDNTQAWTYKQLQDMRSGLDGLTENNRERLFIEERMAAMRGYERKITNEVRSQSQDILEGKRDYELDKELIMARSRFETINASEKKLAEKLSAAKAEAAENSKRMIVGEQLKAEVEHLRNLLFKYESRINELVVQSNAAIRVSVTDRAQVPKNQAGSNAKKLFLIAVAIPFLLVVVVFFFAELSDDRIRKPVNIVHALGVPPSWPVSRAPEGISFYRAGQDAPESACAKALQSLALRLLKDNQDNETRVFLFNGVGRSIGATGIALNTGYFLGKFVPRIIFIEYPFEPSALRPFYKVSSRHPGITELMDGRAGFEDCVYTDYERNIDIIFAPASEASKKAVSLIYKKVIAEAKKEYDMVIIDAPPISGCETTEYLAMHADVAVMIIQGDGSRYAEVRRAAELFLQMDIPAVAPVLNWGGKKQKSPLQQFFQRPFLKYLVES